MGEVSLPSGENCTCSPAAGSASKLPVHTYPSDADAEVQQGLVKFLPINMATAVTVKHVEGLLRMSALFSAQARVVKNKNEGKTTPGWISHS